MQRWHMISLLFLLSVCLPAVYVSLSSLLVHIYACAAATTAVRLMVSAAVW